MDGSQALDIPVLSPPTLGDYRIVAEIGRGGMADVYLALTTSPSGPGTPVVIKKLRSDVMEDDDFRAMFCDEARLAQKLRHPNVVETFDVGQDGEACFIVMEFLDGQPLSRIRSFARKLRAATPLSIHLRILADVLTGLQYVHELADRDGVSLGVVHRDVTPQNIFITYDGNVKVVDFGIAKARARQVETRVGVVKGKLSYIAPESVRGDSVDLRSDLFSVGVLLWEAATGKRFWHGLDELEIYKRLAAGDLPTESGAADIPPQLFAIVARALAPNPQHRFASAAQMRAALGALPQLMASRTAVSGYLYQLFVEERRRFHDRVSEEIARLESGQWPAELPRLEPERPPSSTPVPTSPTVRTMFATATEAPVQRRAFQTPASVLVGLAAAAIVLSIWMVVRDTPPNAPRSAAAVATSLAPPATASPPPPSSAPPVIEALAASNAPTQSSAIASPPRPYRPPAFYKPANKKVEPPESLSDLPRQARPRRRLDVDDPWSR